MSLIASFWTLDSRRREELVSAFRPVQRVRTERRWILLKETKAETVYPWHEFLRANATREARFGYSGAAMVDLELMLPKETSLFSLALPESDVMSASSGVSVALIDEPTARLALERLSEVNLRQEDVVRFYEEDERPLSDPGEAEAVLAAKRQSMIWCRSVMSGRIGLLMVG